MPDQATTLKACSLKKGACHTLSGFDALHHKCGISSHNANNFKNRVLQDSTHPVQLVLSMASGQSNLRVV